MIFLSRHFEISNKTPYFAFKGFPVGPALQAAPKSNQMKNKVTLLVLVVEILAIVVLHSTRSSNRPESDRSAHMQSGSSQFPIAEEKHPISYTSLK